MPQEIGWDGFIPNGLKIELLKCHQFLHKFFNFLDEKIGYYDDHIIKDHHKDHIINYILSAMDVNTLPIDLEIDEYLFRIVCVEDDFFRFTILDESSEYYGRSILLSLERHDMRISYAEIDFSTWTLDSRFMAERAGSCENGIPLYKITVCYPDDSWYMIVVRILLEISTMNKNCFLVERYHDYQECVIPDTYLSERILSIN